MKTIRIFVVCLGVCLACGCATVKKPVVVDKQSSPQISQTIQAAQVQKYAGLKRKVAIARFSNETKYGQGFFLDQNADRVGKQAVDILSAKLLATEKFILLERADLDKIQQELSIGNKGTYDNNADFIIVGSVTEFGRNTESQVGVFSRTKKQSAFAKVHIRLIDTYTGQIIYSEEGEGTALSEAGTVFGMGSTAGYDSALNDKALEAAIGNLTSNVIENLLDKPWRAYILGFEEGYYLMSGGQSQNIRPGDVFDVLKKGKEVVNPQSNMKISLPSTRIAEIRVAALHGDNPGNELSFCELVSGDILGHCPAGDFTTLYVSSKE